ncbi:heterokaryon incompatibility protein-domain-containing protein [Mariannaea sp. PMI_226]|nr:heterokaryon incompatibility protein-domain-containing protein [Mariannaea sp. PMI_226]
MSRANPGEPVYIPSVDVLQLSHKHQYLIWASQIKKKLCGVGIVETPDGQLHLLTAKEALREKRTTVSNARRAEGIALRILLLYLAPSLFNSGDLTYTYSPWKLWKSIAAWAKSPGPATCVVCGNIRKVKRSNKFDLELARKPAVEFHKAWQWGCHLCRMILDAAEAFSPAFCEDLSEKIITIMGVPHPIKPLPLTVEYQVNNSTSWQTASFTLDIYDETQVSSIDALNGNQRLAQSSDGLPDETISWIQQKRKDCECRGLSLDFVPHRLVHVGMDGDVPFLVENQPPSTPYCALSYCWGNGPHSLLTTRASLQDHLQAIELSSMPQTIRDAVIVCRKLNISYLWVDALCIVQDAINSGDWAQQCAQMREIYSSADLVLAVHSCADSHEGFLRKTANDSARRFPIETTHLDGTTDRKVVQENKPGLHNDQTYLQTKTPLSNRAWTLQETVLARRILHWTTSHLVWECEDGIECECGQSYKRGFDILSLHRAGSVSTWHKLVETYSHRCLTKPSDKLIAMAGLVSIISSRYCLKPSKYLGGLWLDHLPKDLLWYVCGDGPHKRIASYRAPSWTWASIDGGIKFVSFDQWPSYQFKASVSILEARCDPKATDPFGQLVDGFILLVGKLAEVCMVSLSQNFRKSRGEYSGRDGRPCRTHDGRTTLVRRDSQQVFEVLCDEPDYVGFYGDEEDRTCWLEGKCQNLPEVCSCEDVQEASKFYCLEIGELTPYVEKERGGESDDEASLKKFQSKLTWWMVLRRSSRREEAFERVGIGYRISSGRDQCRLFQGCTPQQVCLV